MNFELVDIEYVKEGKDHFLRISIDKEGGVDLNDCTIASEKLVKLWMKMIQYLKCIILMHNSSPGAAERPTKRKDFYNAINQPILYLFMHHN